VKVSHRTSLIRGGRLCDSCSAAVIRSIPFRSTVVFWISPVIPKTTFPIRLSIESDRQVGRYPFRKSSSATPSNTAVRDLQAEPPPWRGKGSKPKRRFEQAQAWAAALPESAWTRIDVRDGHRGPLVLDIVKTRVQAKTDTNGVGPEELLVVARRREDDGTWIHAYYLSNAPADTSLAELARVAKAEHRVEDCFQRAKSEAGLADYEVRTWIGWYHHQTLSFLAGWCLVQETQRGKKIHAGLDGVTSPRGTGNAATARLWLLPSQLHSPRNPTPSKANGPGSTLSLATT
jgi:hypothetical protein